MSGHIRRARHDERDRITEIRFAVQENRLGNPALVTAGDYAWFTEHPGIWVWEEDGQVQGFAAGDPRDGTIWALFVDPRCEGRGIGRALFGAACDTLRRAGHRTAMLTTDPGTRAERFYRTAGWKVVGNSTRDELIFGRFSEVLDHAPSASSTIRLSSTCAPAARSAASVCSLTL